MAGDLGITPGFETDLVVTIEKIRGRGSRVHELAVEEEGKGGHPKFYVLTGS